MDGWGKGTVPASDAILHAKTPFVDSLYDAYPNSTLVTCGEAVGLPDGQMGNSEVGHLNLGAGRVVYQELQRINVAIRNHELKNNEVLIKAMEGAKAPGKTLHLMGLLSDGGVHSHILHLLALVDLAVERGVTRIAIHAFTDGRDTDPKSGTQFLAQLLDHIKDIPQAFLATVTGRYYAMDRDKRWERIELAYNALVRGHGQHTLDAIATLERHYEEGTTDEFLKPLILTDEKDEPLATIQENEVVICFNFRTDRCREITEALTQKSFPEFGMGPLKLLYVTMTEYDATYHNVEAIFHADNLTHTLGEVLSSAGKKQIRIAETEKYPHVTFFFSGGRETPFEGETRIMKPSPKDVPTYDFKPEMSAGDLTNAILPELEQESADFICLNFANADMVGHTGVWEAAIKAVETVDQCVSRIVPVALAHGYGIFLTADHGNSDFLINADGTPNTAHTLNLVPLFLISNDYHGRLKDGKLGDIAPSILRYMGLEVPPEMTGYLLITV